LVGNLLNKSKWEKKLRVKKQTTKLGTYTQAGREYPPIQSLSNPQMKLVPMFDWVILLDDEQKKGLIPRVPTFLI